jgi:hypothetical protein
MVREAMGSQGPVIQLSWLVVGLLGQVWGGGCCERVLFGSAHFVFVCPEISRREGFSNRVAASSGSVVCLDTVYLELLSV